MRKDGEESVTVLVNLHSFGYVVTFIRVYGIPPYGVCSSVRRLNLSQVIFIVGIDLLSEDDGPTPLFSNGEIIFRVV